MSQAQESWSLRRAWRTLSLHKKKAGGVFLAVLAVAFCLAAFLPRKYKSEARLMVRLGRASMTLDPTVTTGQLASVQESRENEINSVVDVLQSRMLHERVAKQVGPEQVVGETGGEPGLLSVSHWFTQVGLSEPLSAFENAVQQLEEDVEVRRSKDSSVINLTYEAESPESAQRVVQAYVDLFLEEHVRVNRTLGSYQFFIDQQQKLRREVEEAAVALRDAKNELGLTTVDGQRQALHRQIGDVDGALFAARAELASVEAAIESEQDTVDDLPERIRTDEVRGHPNLAADGMRQSLYQLEVKHLDLLSRYTPDHPQVLAVGEQLAEARRIVERQEADRPQSTETVNSSRRSLQLQLLKNRSQAKALAAKVDALAQQAVELQQRRQALNDGEVRIAELERRVDLAEASYRDYVADTEQARIDQELEAGRISNISVVQSATLVTQPVKPRRTMILGLGLLIALFAGVATALACEALWPSLHDEDEVEDDLNVPVLAAL
jgi:uncharacterized protein involved in exopolysaccharide biosynthesis